MPTINDAIVVSGSGYSTEGNGGRKLVILNNKNLYAILKTTTNYIVQRSSDNGTNWSQIKKVVSASVQDVALATDGTLLYALTAITNSTVVLKVMQEDGTELQTVNVDTSQTAIGNVSLAINEAKTELHAAWTSKNSTYPNSFNIRYAKGTINADGTVTWGAITQISAVNQINANYSNPSVVVNKNGFPTIIYDYNYSTAGNRIESVNYNGSVWNTSTVFNNVGYAQSSPSAIYVPQSINGLENGRIWVAWHGTDSTNPTHESIKVSYSDNLGASWSTANSAVSNPNYYYRYPTITANNKNEIFIVFTSLAVGQGLMYIKNSNDAWGSLNTIGSENSTTYPNSIDDKSLNFSEPLFIFQNSSKVGFYGTWTVETISPTVGERGQILNRQNILTYNITSDSTIGTVTEKINGVVVGTKTLTSGQNTTVNITQAQWDAIPYGKYRNNSAGRNTIEIVTSNNTFTYTFEKWFDNTLDVISATKAVKDSKDYYLPSAKKILSDAINSKGGSTTPTDSIESMANSIKNSSLKNTKTGTIVSGSSTASLTNYNGSAITTYYGDFDMSQLPFVPSYIVFTNAAKNSQSIGGTWFYSDFMNNGISTSANSNSNTVAVRVPYTNGIVRLALGAASTQYDWVAYE